MMRLRRITALSLLVAMALSAASCGGGDKDADPTPVPTAAADDIGANLPTVPAPVLEAEFVNEARNIQAFLEFAGGIRKPCEKSPCAQSENPLVNWANAANRCGKLGTYAGISANGSGPAKALYGGLTTTCAKVTDTLKKVNTSTAPAEHRRLADEALSGLPGLIAATVR